MNSAIQDASIQIANEFRFQWEEAQQCFVLLYPEGMIQLSATAGEILQRCQEKIQLKDLLNELQQQFPEADRLVDDVLDFIDDAAQQGWIKRDSHEV